MRGRTLPPARVVLLQHRDLVPLLDAQLPLARLRVGVQRPHHLSACALIIYIYIYIYIYPSLARHDGAHHLCALMCFCDAEASAATCGRRPSTPKGGGSLPLSVPLFLPRPLRASYCGSCCALYFDLTAALNPRLVRLLLRPWL